MVAETREEQIRWFKEARFGLFLHWGIYAIPARGEWVLFKEQLDRNEYNKYADQFRAERYDPDAWAALAKAAGMKYVVLTTRHHDGFCLFDTKTTSFNSVQHAAGRDLVAEYVAAMRRAGLGVGLYFSIMSWQQPAIYTGPGIDPRGWERMVNETHAQVRELMSNYGRIDLLWYDGAAVPGIADPGMQARFWRSQELNAMVRELQPHILINNRSGLPADFDTPEQHVNPPRRRRTWEACMTLNRNWGYHATDKDFKSPLDVTRCLVRCARYDGNLLLNVGPMADGTVQPEAVSCLEKVGEWMATNGEAIYGTQRTAYTEANHVAGPVTQRGNRLYVHLMQQPGPEIRLDGVRATESIKLLGSDKALTTEPPHGRGLLIGGLPAELAVENGSAVVAVELKGKPSKCANLLGGGDAIRIVAGDAPVLGDDPDRHAPPLAPVVTGKALAKMVVRPRPIEAGQAWCPGWIGWEVVNCGKQTSLSLPSVVPGTYDLAVGLVTKEPGKVTVTLNNDPLALGEKMPNVGFPTTWRFEGLKLSGSGSLKLKSTVPVGLYALQLTPRWRPLPSPSWWVIGPFPTAFGPQRPVSDVKDALKRRFPPEREFQLGAVYDGIGGRRVSWTHHRGTPGRHSDAGVNFPYRCGIEVSGVCFARTVVTCPEPRAATLLLGCDWWANVWLNGRRVKSKRNLELIAEDGAQFNTWKPQPARIHLKAGRNELLVKCHPGSGANWFVCYLSDPGDLRVEPGT